SPLAPGSDSVDPTPPAAVWLWSRAYAHGRVARGARQYDVTSQSVRLPALGESDSRLHEPRHPAPTAVHDLPSQCSRTALANCVTSSGSEVTDTRVATATRSLTSRRDSTRPTLHKLAPKAIAPSHSMADAIPYVRRSSRPCSASTVAAHCEASGPQGAGCDIVYKEVHVPLEGFGVFLHRHDIIGMLLVDGVGDILLASSGIDRHDASS